MNAVRGQNSEFTWTPEMEEDFQKLKAQFKNTNGRTFPDYKSTEPFILTIDFSGKAVGVTLSQVQNQQEKLIAAAGRKNTSGEQNYASWKGEYMALVYGIRKFEHILSFKPFEVRTDSMTLTYRPNIRPTTGILARWMEYLAGFEFSVKHISGKKNLVADAISRTPHHLDDPSKDEEEEAAAYAIHMIQMAPKPPPTHLSVKSDQIRRTRVIKSTEGRYHLEPGHEMDKGSKLPARTQSN